MHDLSQLDESFKRYYKEITKGSPESILHIDLHHLQQLGLLSYHNKNVNHSNLTRYFHVIDAPDKITLVNDDFIIWIVPEKENEVATTYSLIALNKDEGPKLEITFVTQGVYNTSRLVIRILEKFLWDIQENEELLESL